MKKLRSYLLILPVLFFTVVSCNHVHDHNEGSTGQAQHKDHSNQKLVLNNGEKWNANTETTTGIAAMKKLVSDYEAGSKTPETQMGADLQKEVDSVIQQCTMTGEAHEQLHYFLMPLIEMVDDIKNTEVSEQQFKDLQVHLNKYDQYFK